LFVDDQNCITSGDALDQAPKNRAGFCRSFAVPANAAMARRCDTPRLGRRQTFAVMMPAKITETS
jgi:hypothetical protein